MIAMCVLVFGSDETDQYAHDMPTDVGHQRAGRTL
jgi:hypothetical protein